MPLAAPERVSDVCRHRCGKGNSCRQVYGVEILGEQAALAFFLSRLSNLAPVVGPLWKIKHGKSFNFLYLYVKLHAIKLRFPEIGTIREMLIRMLE